MNEEGVIHRQMPSQFTQAEALTAIEFLGTHTPTAAGTSILAASKNESSVSFSRRKSVKVLRRLHTIKLNELLEHSQVYVDEEGFDFVLDYILKRVPKETKIRKG